MSSPRNRFVLRPLEIKHLFDFAIRLLRFNFLPMFLSMALVHLPIALLTIPMMMRFLSFTNELQDPTKMGSVSESEIFNNLLLNQTDSLVMMGGGMLLIAIYQLLVTPLGLLSCARLAARALDGFADSFSDAFQFALTRYWPTQVALATFFLPTLAVAVIVLVIMVLATLGGGSSGATTAVAVVAATGIFLIFAAGIATMFMYFRFFPALSGVLQASEEAPEEGMVAQGIWYLKRSYGLTEANYFRIFGILGMMWLVNYFFSQGVNGTLETIKMLHDYFVRGGGGFEQFITMQAEGRNDPVQTGIIMAVQTILLLIFPPMWQCYKLLVFNDLRCRKEAYDIYLLLEEEAAARATLQ